MDWQVVFYQDADGNEPVKDFILAQSKGTQAEIIRVMDLLYRLNVNLHMPYVEKIGKSGIRALRIKHSSDIYRIFFFAYTGRKFVLLHAITKKSDKLKQSDINLAIQRMDEFKERY